MLCIIIQLNLIIIIVIVVIVIRRLSLRAVNALFRVRERSLLYSVVRFFFFFFKFSVCLFVGEPRVDLSINYSNETTYFSSSARDVITLALPCVSLTFFVFRRHTIEHRVRHTADTNSKQQQLRPNEPVFEILI